MVGCKLYRQNAHSNRVAELATYPHMLEGGTMECECRMKWCCQFSVNVDDYGPSTAQ